MSEGESEKQRLVSHSKRECVLGRLAVRVEVCRAAVLRQKQAQENCARRVELLRGTLCELQAELECIDDWLVGLGERLGVAGGSGRLVSSRERLSWASSSRERLPCVSSLCVLEARAQVEPVEPGPCQLPRSASRHAGRAALALDRAAFRGRLRATPAGLR